MEPTTLLHPLLLMQRGVPALLRPRHDQPANARGPQQRDQDGLKDRDSRPGRDDPRNDRKQGPADLCKHKDERQRCRARLRVEQLRRHRYALHPSVQVVRGATDGTYSGEEGAGEESEEADCNRSGDDIGDTATPSAVSTQKPDAKGTRKTHNQNTSWNAMHRTMYRHIIRRSPSRYVGSARSSRPRNAPPL